VRLLRRPPQLLTMTTLLLRLCELHAVERSDLNLPDHYGKPNYLEIASPAYGGLAMTDREVSLRKSNYLKIAAPRYAGLAMTERELALRVPKSEVISTSPHVIARSRYSLVFVRNHPSLVIARSHPSLVFARSETTKQSPYPTSVRKLQLSRDCFARLWRPRNDG
jgi:hypothetical protein